MDASYARQQQAGEVLERIFKELPDHPAAAHYIIHAYDCGLLAERALEAAKRYAKSASVVPHAIHMWPPPPPPPRASASVAIPALPTAMAAATRETSP